MPTPSARAAIAQQVASRVPRTSHSLRRLLTRLCIDPLVPLVAVRALEQAVEAGKRDVCTWHAAISAVGKHSVLRGLLAMVDDADTGPCTAQYIRDAHDRMLRRRERRATEAGAAAAAEATAEATAAAREAREERERQVWLSSVFTDNGV